MLALAGRKSFLPPCDLTMGFGFLFKVDETCIARHLHERKIHTAEDDEQLSVVSLVCGESRLWAHMHCGTSSVTFCMQVNRPLFNKPKYPHIVQDNLDL